MSAAQIPQIERLVGRENYATWKFAVEAYLRLDGLWDVVDGTMKSTNQNYSTKDRKAKSKLILLIDPVNYVHVEQAVMAKEIWDKLRSAEVSRLFALQLGLKIDRKSDEAKALLTAIMDWLETQKKALSDNEAVTNDVAAQAHIENYALKLFLYADSQDRASNFGKNVVKAFYTAGVLYDVLTTFGELTDEATQNRKYAKWKAAYIHNCLKNGETPVPGPMQDELDENTDQPGENADTSSVTGIDSSDMRNFGATTPSGQMGFISPSASSSAGPSFPNVPNKVTDIPAPYTVPQPATPTEGPSNLPLNPSLNVNIPQPTGNGSSTSLNPAQITKAQKYCKWASSALNYDDVPTAIENLEKALVLLRTGADTG